MPSPARPSLDPRPIVRRAAPAMLLALVAACSSPLEKPPVEQRYYTLDANRVVPTIFPAYGVSFPSLYDIENAVTITMTAGYANQAAVPKLYQHLAFLKVAQLFLQREGYGIEGNRTEFETAYNSLLMRAIRSTYP